MGTMHKRTFKLPAIFLNLSNGKMRRFPSQVIISYQSKQGSATAKGWERWMLFFTTYESLRKWNHLLHCQSSKNSCVCNSMAAEPAAWTGDMSHCLRLSQKEGWHLPPTPTFGAKNIQGNRTSRWRTSSRCILGHSNSQTGHSDWNFLKFLAKSYPSTYISNIVLDLNYYILTNYTSQLYSQDLQAPTTWGNNPVTKEI